MRRYDWSDVEGRMIAAGWDKKLDEPIRDRGRQVIERRITYFHGRRTRLVWVYYLDKDTNQRIESGFIYEDMLEKIQQMHALDETGLSAM